MPTADFAFSVRNIVKPDTNDTSGWQTVQCGHCGRHGAAFVIGYFEVPRLAGNGQSGQRKWLICTSCGKGTFLDYDGQVYPAPLLGFEVEGLPSSVSAAWAEARICISQGALTACELICRTILMHIAVEKGAEARQSFASYVTHLAAGQYITPSMKSWVDQIRINGNEATHELNQPDKTRALSTLEFTGELLRIVYEMEFKQQTYTQGQEPPL